MNISFGGCGFLGIYHIGVIRALANHGAQFLGQVDKVAGTSAGALVGTILVCDPQKINECKKFNLNLAEETRKKPLGPFTRGFNILVPVKEYLETSIPEDGHIKANGRLYISVTNFSKRKSEQISTYKSRDELIQCLIASCHLPWFSGFDLPNMNGDKYIDGGFSENLHVFKEGRTVTVSPFCGGQDIEPCDDSSGHKIRINNQPILINKANIERGKHAYMPPPEDVLLKYFYCGYGDAVNFLKRNNFYQHNESISSMTVTSELNKSMELEKHMN